jgi:Zn-dependent protease
MSRTTDTPFGRGLVVTRVSGVQVCAHWSLLVVLALLTTLLAQSELPALAPGSATATYWLVGAATSFVFVASIAAHELAHAVVARRFGIPVQRMTLWMLGGLTELESEPASPRIDAWVAAAGPLVSFGCGVVFTGLAAVSGAGSLYGAALAWLAITSFLLAFFNLLPGAPLDGGRLLRAFVWHRTGDRVRAGRAAAHVGRVAGTGLVVLGILAILAGDPGGLWISVVGWFIITAARSEEYSGRSERLGGLVASDVMDPAPLSCPNWWTLDTFLASIDPAHAGQAAFPLVDTDGRATGVLSLFDLERAVRRSATAARVSDLHRGPPVPIVAGNAPLADIVLAIHLRGHVAVVVDDHGRPIGLIEENTIARATRIARLGGIASQTAGVIVALAVLAACSSSSSSVVRTGGSSPSSPVTSSPVTSSAPLTISAPVSPSTSGARQPRVTVTPSVNLRNGQTVRVRGTGFSPLEALQIIECADKGNATGPGDCNLAAMLGATSDRTGIVDAQLRVLRGPFGGNGVVCSAKQACLVSVTQASLSPTEQANAPIRFALTG